MLNNVARKTLKGFSCAFRGPELVASALPKAASHLRHSTSLQLDQRHRARKVHSISVALCERVGGGPSKGFHAAC